MQAYARKIVAVQLAASPNYTGAFVRHWGDAWARFVFNSGVVSVQVFAESGNVAGFIPVTRRGWISMEGDGRPIFCTLRPRNGRVKLFSKKYATLYEAIASIKHPLRRYEYVNSSIQNQTRGDVWGSILPLSALHELRWSNNPQQSTDSYLVGPVPNTEGAVLIPHDGGSTKTVEGSSAKLLDIGKFVSLGKVDKYPNDALALTGNGYTDGKILPKNPAIGSAMGEVTTASFPMTLSGPDRDIPVVIDVRWDPVNLMTVICAHYVGNMEGELIVLPMSLPIVPSETNDMLFVYGISNTSLESTLQFINENSGSWIKTAQGRKYAGDSNYLKTNEFSDLTLNYSAAVPVMHISAKLVGADVRLSLVVYDAFKLCGSDALEKYASSVRTMTSTATEYVFSDCTVPVSRVSSVSGGYVVTAPPRHQSGLKFSPPEIAFCALQYDSTYDRQSVDFSDQFGKNWEQSYHKDTRGFFVNGKLVSTVTQDWHMTQSNVYGESDYEWSTQLEAFHVCGWCARTGAIVVARTVADESIEIWAVYGGKAYKFPDVDGIKTRLLSSAVGTYLGWIGNGFASIIKGAALITVNETMTVDSPATCLSTFSTNQVQGMKIAKDVLAISVALPLCVGDPSRPIPYDYQIYNYAPPNVSSEGECIASMVVNLATEQCVSLKSYFGVPDNVFMYGTNGPQGLSDEKLTVKDIDALLDTP